MISYSQVRILGEEASCSMGISYIEGGSEFVKIELQCEDSKIQQGLFCFS